MVWCAIVPNCTLLFVPPDADNEEEYAGGYRRNDLWACNDVEPFTCKEQIDPDISGIGMILAFAISAIIVFAVVVTGYITRQLGTESFNTIDRGILSLIHRRKIKKDDGQRSDWSEVSDKTVLMLSDQQLVTGIAILIAAFAQICTINTYHFQICTFLAWIASNTHLLAMTSLRPFLKARPNLLRWRLVGIFVMFAMLLAALVLNASVWWPSSYNNWQLYYDSPARCAWNKNAYTTWEDSIIFSIVLLCINYLTRTLRLFDASKDFINTWTREKPGRIALKVLDRFWRNAHRDEIQRFMWRVLYNLLWGIYLVWFASLELYHSYVAEIGWLFATLFWGLCKVFIVRRDSPLTEYENTWGFGQVVALGLLILPIMAAFEVYHDVSLHHKQASHIPFSHHMALPRSCKHDSPKEKSPSSQTTTTPAHELNQRLPKPTRATTDLSDYSSMHCQTPPLRFTNSLPTTSHTIAPITFTNTLPTSSVHDSEDASHALSFTNHLPTNTTDVYTGPIATIPPAPHTTSPYSSLYFILLIATLAGLCLLPFIIFIQVVFALSNQFTFEAFTVALIYWGIALAGAVPGWILLGVVAGSGLWGEDRKRRGIARYVVKWVQMGWRFVRRSASGKWRRKEGGRTTASTSTTTADQAG